MIIIMIMMMINWQYSMVNKILKIMVMIILNL
jgi:hypothetical protein